MIPLAIPNLCGNEARYLQECVSTGFVSSVGSFVGRFEALVAQSAGTPGAVATSAGTTGLHLALVTVGVQPGELVIIPSYTFIATANAVSHAGAIPWLFDVSPDDWCLDPALLQDTLARETERRFGGLFHIASGRRVAALMPVFALGLIPEFSPYRLIASEYGLPLVADAAPAVGARRDDKGVGAFADLTVFSFNGNKTVTSGGGGAIVSADKTLLARAKHLSSTARSGEDYTHDQVGFNYRMTNVEAAVGCAQMENLAMFIAAKRRIRDSYRSVLQGFTQISFSPEAPDRGNACWFSGFVFCENGREQFAKLNTLLNAAGVQCRPFWKPVHLQAPYAHAPRTPMPVCGALWERVVVLPSSTQLTAEEQNTVIKEVSSFLHSA
ncbi:MAG: aminotransferase class I/II-fold pyridoxal phosphate-dependent enzyme [Opitutaceae bacterium]|jgi:dTDP-4-amino-4,6-dideoxygalactose transaminase